MNPLIITRHQGLVDWLKKHYNITGTIIPHVTNPNLLTGRIVIGILPLHLAAKAQEIWTIDMPNLPAEKRGQEVTAEEMEQFGATLSKYKVTKL